MRKINTLKKSVLSLTILASTLIASQAMALSIKGFGVTTSSSATGKAVQGQNQFIVDISSQDNGAYSGVLSSVATFDPTRNHKQLTQGFGTIANGECLQADSTDANKVWFSGTVTFITPDPRLNDATNAQIAEGVKTGNYIVGGYFIDNGNGIDKRSLFTFGYSTQQKDVSDPSPTNIQSIPVGLLGQNGSTLCKTMDNIGKSADYYRITAANCDGNGGNDCVQWLDGATGANLGAPVANTAANLSAPPVGAEYNISTITRDFTIGNIIITK